MALAQSLRLGAGARPPLTRARTTRPRRAAPRSCSAKQPPAYLKPLIAMTADIPADERTTITYGLSCVAQWAG